MKKKSIKRKSKAIGSDEFDRKFDSGESIIEYFDLDTAVRRVNVDFPSWTIEVLDKESDRLGVSRQSLIKTWIVEKIDKLQKGREVPGNRR